MCTRTIKVGDHRFAPDKINCISKVQSGLRIEFNNNSIFFSQSEIQTLPKGEQEALLKLFTAGFGRFEL